MEPTSRQFDSTSQVPSQRVFRKGEDQSALAQHGIQQQLGDMSAARKRNPMEQLDYEISSGIDTAKDAVRGKATVQELSDRPEALKGPMSGSALAKEKKAARDKKKASDKDKKRR